MKAVNRICQVLAIVLALACLALFFMPFATLTINGNDETFIGAVLAFGSNKELTGGTVVNMARSADILFCFWLTAIGFLISIFSFKKKGLRYAAPVFALAPAIYMLVVALSNPWKFVDTRAGLPERVYSVTDVKYTSFVLILAIALFLFAAFAIAYLLIDDAIEVKQSKGAKKTIFKRIGLFLRDYKSEVNKIVWPNIKDVLKNTAIVLAMCLIVGAFIWLLDLGLGKLIQLILGIQS